MKMTEQFLKDVELIFGCWNTDDQEKIKAGLNYIITHPDLSYDEFHHILLSIDKCYQNYYDNNK